MADEPRVVRHIGWYDEATLRIEYLERRLTKVERKAKKAKR